MSKWNSSKIFNFTTVMLLKYSKFILYFVNYRYLASLLPLNVSSAIIVALDVKKKDISASPQFYPWMNKI
jgi:hypothetical protein